MQQPAPGTNPNLPGVSISQTVILAEKLHVLHNEGMGTCYEKCVTHWGEDSIPYHPGEKSCMDRCLNKLYDSYSMAKRIRTEFQAKLKRQEMPPWVAQLEAEL